MTGSPLVKEVVSFAAFVVAMGIFWRYIQKSFSNLQGESERATVERERIVEAFCNYLKEKQKTSGALSALIATIETHEAYIRGYVADRPRSPT
jgi:hypothetical protein